MGGGDRLNPRDAGSPRAPEVPKAAAPGKRTLTGGLQLKRASGTAAVQMKGGDDSLAWRNAVIEGESRIQQIVRGAQEREKGQLVLDIVVEPDFVGVEHHEASGKAPSGKAPDGIAVHKAAEAALETYVDAAVTSRRVYRVVLERTASGWERVSFHNVGETKKVEDADVRSADAGAWDIEQRLNLAAGAGMGAVTFDVVTGDGGVRIVNWRASGSATKGKKAPATDKAKKSFTDFLSVSGGDGKLLEYTCVLDGGEWVLQKYQLLGQLQEKTADDGSGSDGGSQPDEGQLVIDDIKATRRLILTTAAQLIAEQDPTRLDNLLFSAGPFALAGVVKLGKVAKLGNLAKLVGRPARRVFGETTFTGLVQNRKLKDLTHAEIYDAFKGTPFTPSNHAISRLKDPRTEAIGFETLNDIKKVLNDGVVAKSREVLSLEYRSMKAIVDPETRMIITFSPM